MKVTLVCYFICYLSSVVFANQDEDISEAGEFRKRFLPLTTRLTHHQAKVNCEQEGKMLATVKTRAEQSNLEDTLIRKGIYNSNMWIGANDLIHEGQFMWIGDAKPFPVRYTNWALGQPNNLNNNEHCVVISNNYLWDDRNCDEYMEYICEYYASKDED